MTMMERLKIHKQIEHDMHESIECYLYWESLTAAEVASMIQEKDRAMEWDDQFSFLCELLNRKLEKEGEQK